MIKNLFRCKVWTEIEKKENEVSKDFFKLVEVAVMQSGFDM